MLTGFLTVSTCNSLLGDSFWLGQLALRARGRMEVPESEKSPASSLTGRACGQMFHPSHPLDGITEANLCIISSSLEPQLPMVIICLKEHPVLAAISFLPHFPTPCLINVSWNHLPNKLLALESVSKGRILGEPHVRYAF
uniref:Uncharacterized protein n=1 Tax=Rousettus aegyptiacus TaxID=9407 RepID=A0A7J8DXT8_ROUAE|nr:hypothetical protein HJG63_008398 [Rousettus aegyptiacus]